MRLFLVFLSFIALIFFSDGYGSSNKATTNKSKEKINTTTSKVRGKTTQQRQIKTSTPRPQNRQRTNVNIGSTLQFPPLRKESPIQPAKILTPPQYGPEKTEENIKTLFQKGRDDLTTYQKNPSEDFVDNRQEIKHFMQRQVTESHEMSNLRNQWIKEFVTIISSASPTNTYPYYKLQGIISRDLKMWVKDKIDTYMKNIPPPSNICVFVMGSLTTELSTFYSDIELGVFLEKLAPDIMEYVSDMIQSVSVKIRFLKERDKGVRLDEADLSPLHLNPELNKIAKESPSFTLTSQSLAGSRYLIAPPEIMATYPFIILQHLPNYEHTFYEKYQSAYFENIKKNNLKIPQYAHNDNPLTHLWKSMARNPFMDWRRGNDDQKIAELNQIAQIAKAMKTTDYLAGDKRLYDAFLSERKKNLDKYNVYDTYDDRIHGIIHRKSTLRQRLISDINFDLNKFLDKNNFLKMAKHTRYINIKKDIFRPIEQILLNYAFSFDWHTNDLFKILDLLQEHHIFGETSVLRIKDFLNFSSYLRLWEQYILKDKTSDICLKDDVCSVSIKSEENQVDFWKNEIKTLEASLPGIQSIENVKDKESQLASFETSMQNAHFQMQLHQNNVENYKKSLFNTGFIPGSKIQVPILSEEVQKILFEEYYSVLQGITTAMINPFKDIEYELDHTYNLPPSILIKVPQRLP